MNKADRAAYMRRYRAKKKEWGVCLDCARPAEWDHIRCTHHRILHSLQNK